MERLQPADKAFRLWAAIVGGLLVGLIALYIRYPMREIAYDFQAFWCGGHALLQHASPYLNEPLHSCETHSVSALFARFPNLTVPAPLPPYALALFVPFALLPFWTAGIIWWLLLGISMYAIGRGIALLAGITVARAMTLSLLAVAGPTIVQGALAPVPIALVVWAAVALRRAQWNKAALLLGCAMIEPHMALPACAVVFLIVPVMRRRLLLAGVCAAALSVLSVGPHVAWSYLTVMLPLHAASEVNNLGQDSFTTVLYHLGVPAALALRLASVQYVSLAIIGGWAATRLTRSDGDRSWLVLLPAGLAVIGGTFVHLSEVAMAVPLASMVAARFPSRVTSAVVTFLAIPTESVINWAALAVPASYVVAWFAAMSDRVRSSRYGGAIVLSIGCTVILAALLLHLPAAATGHDQWATTVRLLSPPPTASASVVWAQFNSFSHAPSVWWLEKAFTLLPLCALIVVILRAAWRVDAAVGRRENSVARLSPEAVS